MTVTSDYMEKRSMRIGGHRTSLAFEPPFWSALERMAKHRDQTLPVMFAAFGEAIPLESKQTLASYARVEALKFIANLGAVPL